MTLVTIPSLPQASNTQWQIETPNQENVSPFTGARQVLDSGRGWFKCSYSLPPIGDPATAGEWRAFIAKMRGRANTARVPVDGKPQIGGDPIESGTTLDVNFVTQSYYSGGLAEVLDTPTVAANVRPASRTVTVNMNQANADQVGVGDYATINNQLVMLTDVITFDSDGVGTLTFEPPLRARAFEGQPVEIRNPYCVMAFEEIPTWDYSTGFLYGFSFQFREAF